MPLHPNGPAKACRPIVNRLTVIVNFFASRRFAQANPQQDRSSLIFWDRLLRNSFLPALPEEKGFMIFIH